LLAEGQSIRKGRLKGRLRAKLPAPRCNRTPNIKDTW
jgi:hypothetical protein